MSGTEAAGRQIRDGAWLDGQNFPPLRYAVPDLLPAGFTVIAAPPKAGKSLLILDWLLAKASGGAALGRLPAGPARDVLYLALEDGDRRLQARCRHLLAEGEPIPGRLRYVLAVAPGQLGAVIEDALGGYPDTALLVIDTLARIMPRPYRDESDYQRDYRIGAELKKIADGLPGLAVVVIHHSRKAPSADFIDDVSGTYGLAGAADTIIIVRRPRGRAEGVLQVTGRDVIEAQYAVTFRNGAWALDGADLAEARDNVTSRADAAALSDRSAQIMGFAGEHPEGITPQQAKEKFGEDADRYLRRLADSGLADETQARRICGVRSVRSVRFPGRRGNGHPGVRSVRSVRFAGQRGCGNGHFAFRSVRSVRNRARADRRRPRRGRGSAVVRTGGPPSPYLLRRIPEAVAERGGLSRADLARVLRVGEHDRSFAVSLVVCYRRGEVDFCGGYVVAAPDQLEER